MRGIIRFAIGIACIAVTIVGASSISAENGWYLLIPPCSDYDEKAEFLHGYKILDTKPLSQWAQQGAYDSASECEATRNNLLQVEHYIYIKSSEDYMKAINTKKDPVLLKSIRRITERHNANVDAYAASRCIKCDDPRLKK